MLRIAICDDSPRDLQVIKNHIEYFLMQNAIDAKILEYNDGQALFYEFEDNEESIDIAFLDIYMPNMTGMQVAKKIREVDENIKLVFTTSSIDFALDAYDVFASGYLIKPVDKNKIFYLMEKFILNGNEAGSKYLVMQRGGKAFKISVNKIIYIESDARELIFHMVDGKHEVFYGRLDNIENELDVPYFLRCHKSYLINMNYILNADESFLTNDDEIVPIRKNGAKAIKEQYYKYLLKINFEEM